jgi:hypothetical protein
MTILNVTPKTHSLAGACPKQNLKEYFRPWGTLKDPIEKLHLDDAMESKHNSQELQRTALTNAKPPGSIDTGEIYFKQSDQVPTYLHRGSVDYYEALTKQPCFSSDSGGFIINSSLTKKMIDFFNGFLTKTDSANIILDIKTQCATKQESSKDIPSDKASMTNREKKIAILSRRSEFCCIRF